jgi:ABC-type transport system involved in multi-copper enzyme maturation permease subunit
MSANESLLVPSHSRGWSMGLSNMLGKELSAWYRTRRWWVQSLVALLLMNVTLALNLKDGQRVDLAGMNFLVMAALCVPFAAISLAQDSILGERHSGTAAWVLSKPLRRPAFILAKLIAHGLGLLLAWVVLPGVVAYFQLAAASKGQLSLSAIGWTAAMGLYYLNLFFYLTLALMLATFFNGRGPVLGISLVVAWSGPMQFIAEPIQKYAPWLDQILPWRLLMDVGREGPLAGYLALGQSLPTVVPIIATVLWCVLFIGVTIWRFRREEF